MDNTHEAEEEEFSPNLSSMQGEATKGMWSI